MCHKTIVKSQFNNYLGSYSGIISFYNVINRILSMNKMQKLIIKNVFHRIINMLIFN